MSEESSIPSAQYDAGSYIGSDRAAGGGAPADSEAPPSLRSEIGGYILGFALAIVLTIASFWMAQTKFFYGPALAVALLVLAIAQMGIHLVFFLHITTAPGQANNVLALAFGILTVGFVVLGSLWIMSHMNRMMPATDQMMHRQE